MGLIISTFTIRGSVSKLFFRVGVVAGLFIVYHCTYVSVAVFSDCFCSLYGRVVEFFVLNMEKCRDQCLLCVLLYQRG